jgi:hypothetical protein
MLFYEIDQLDERCRRDREWDVCTGGIVHHWRALFDKELF